MRYLLDTNALLWFLTGDEKLSDRARQLIDDPSNEKFLSIVRLLHALGWPRYNTQIIVPEYSVEGGRVDFALCHPRLKPLAFIEVKQVGQIEGAERQLFQYAVHRGVPIVILTDGREWHFFQPGGQGDYRERRVCKLNLIETDNQGSVRRLDRYLNYELIRTGEAIRAIEDDYRNISKQRQIETSLPEAWIKLVEEADEFLIDVVVEKTESLCGYKPTSEQVLDFLKSLKKEGSQPREEPSLPIRPRRSSTSGKKPPTRLVVTMSNGESIDHHNATETFVEVIEKLGIQRVKDLDKEYIIPLISTDEHPRYTQRKLGRYYIMTQSSTNTKKELLEEIASDLEEKLIVAIVSKD